jgi:hypothetical protein
MSFGFPYFNINFNSLDGRATRVANLSQSSISVKFVAPYHFLSLGVGLSIDAQVVISTNHALYMDTKPYLVPGPLFGQHGLTTFTYNKANQGFQSALHNLIASTTSPHVSIGVYFGSLMMLSS